MLVDTHAHLEMADFDPDRDAVVARALAAGVETIVTVGTTLADAGKAVDLTRRYPCVYAAVGIHPHEARTIDAHTYDTLRALCNTPKVVAYGEVGLDFYWDNSPRDIQRRRFEEQLDVAAALGLPIIIHSRDAQAETLAGLKTWRGGAGVIHCFSGDQSMAETCLDMGFYLSIAGPVTYPRAQSLREVIKTVPLDRLLAETDCPYLSPVPHRGQRNEPAFVAETMKALAALKEISFSEMAAATSANARRLFQLP